MAFVESYKQQASGTITLKVVPGTNHCGVDDNSVTVNYNIEIGFDNDALDDQGFLLDNTAFRGYWTAMSTVPIDISCERLAAKVCRDILGMLGARAANVRYLTVTLSPFDGVSVSHTLTNPPRVA
jgi:hypothetical protein